MPDYLPEEDFFDLLEQMFPDGFGGNDVMQELCPHGWKQSPLYLAFHPTPEQQWDEHVAFQRNMKNLSFRAKDKKNKSDAAPLPDRETFLEEARQKEKKQDESDPTELSRLVGLCLWDIFSDNNDLITPEGSICHVGSFRSTAGLIADFFNMPPGAEKPNLSDFRSWSFDYMEFYMGSFLIGKRTDLTPVYRMIFRRLKATGYSWKYVFTTIGVVRFDKPDEAKTGNWQNYSASEAFGEDVERKQKEAAGDKLISDLDAINREAKKKARSGPTPKEVSSFRDVYGFMPEGWPPDL